MIKKTENCLYCGEKMESVTAKKKFCSALHRVYWNRDKSAKPPTQTILDATKPTNEVKPIEPPKTNYVINTENHRLWKAGDPKEGSMAFMMKYSCESYEQLEKLKSTNQ